MNYDQSKSVYVTINGNRILNLQSVVSNFQREKTVENGVLVAPASQKTVTLRRVRYVGDSHSDGLNLRTLQGFQLNIYTPGYISSFPNCQWLSFTETIGKDNTIIEEMTVTSLSYTMTAI